jgi:hypothetical protein
LGLQDLHLGRRRGEALRDAAHLEHITIAGCWICRDARRFGWVLPKPISDRRAVLLRGSEGADDGHQPTGSVIDEHEQRALLRDPQTTNARSRRSGPARRRSRVGSAVDGRFRRCLSSRHSPASIIHSRKVLRLSVIPLTSRSFSAANAGPKSQYHSRNHRQHRSPQRLGLAPVAAATAALEIRPAELAVRYAFNSRNT